MGSKVYKFADFILNSETRQLSRLTKNIKLSSNAYDILLYLVERRGEAVGKEKLIREIWGGVFVEENNLAVHISALRRVLGEKRGDNKFIETIAGRGYCFVAPVEEIESEQKANAAMRTPVSIADFADKIPSLAVLPLTIEEEEDAPSLKYLAEGFLFP
jgi:DNA-binding winged helix-turn-helix (wHTH) protein